MRTPSKLIAALAPAACAAVLAPAAVAAPPPAMTVAVHPASGAPSSFFTVSASPDGLTQAGTLELQNRHRRAVTVRLDPVGALTATTLGSAYKTPSTQASGAATWIVLPRRRVVLGPRATAMIPVGVRLPGGTGAGDYLSGISVEALGQGRESRAPGNVAVSSIQRYAVGVFVKVPGPRHSLIRLPSAHVVREPAGLSFYVDARNEGNTVLQNVRGKLLITRGDRVVGRTAIGPGTFVSGTSIAYPLLTPREQPREGATYRVRAEMHYDHGKVARLDTLVKFGHASAKRQEDFGGPPVTGPGSHGHLATILIVAVVLLILLALVLLAVWVRRRRVPGPEVALRELSRALAAAGPVSFMRIADFSETPTARPLVAATRARLRRPDRLYRLSRLELLAIAPRTREATLKAVGAELQEDAARIAGPGQVLITVTEGGGRDSEAVLRRLRDVRAEHLDEIEMTADSFVLR